MSRGTKGNVGAILIVASIMFGLLFLGITLAFGVYVTDWVADTVVPDLTSLGMVGNANLTQVGTFTVTPINTVVQSFTWLAGIAYVLALVGCLGLSFAFRFTGSKWLMGLFIGFMFLIVISSIFISNIYQEFYETSGDMGTRLHEQTMLSFLILQSPFIFSVIGFICGAIMFTGEGDENEL